MKDTLKKFRKRIIRGAILKSALASLIIACGVLAVSALASWIFGFKAGLWLSLGLFVGTFLIASLLFFFLKYRPTAKDVARRIDATGLEERLITMMELEGDDSYIARLQREDAQKALAAADHTLIKVAASVALCVAVGVSALFGVGALTVDSLYVAGVLPSGAEAAQFEKDQRQFQVNYSVYKSGGKIYFWEENGIGEEVTAAIPVMSGEDAPAIIVVPDDGYTFVGWSDGVYDPYRKETAVDRSITVRASFEKVEWLEDLMDDSENGDSNGNSNDEDGEPGDMTDAPPGESNTQSPSNSQEGGDGHSDNNKQVNDGNTFYGDEYGQAYEDAMGRLGDESEIPGNLQGGITGYLDSIGKGSSEEDGSSGGEGTGDATP